jgi:hypothetical protein
MVGPNRYTFDPFGRDVSLFNPAQPGLRPFDLMGRVNLPFPLQRYPLYAGASGYAAPSPVAVRVNGQSVADAAIGWCDLTEWTPPTAGGINVAVDPVLGRLVFATAPAASDSVEVGYTYAFSGDYGGGPYLPGVPRDEAALEARLGPPNLVGNFATANLAGAHNEVVEIGDSGIHAGDLSLSPDAHLLVVRAGEGQRPVVAGHVSVSGVAGASLTLRGLGIGDSLVVSGAGPLTVRLEHCTVRGGIEWTSAAVNGRLVVDHSLCGAIAAHGGVEVTVADSAVDAGSDTAPAVFGGAGAAAGSVSVARSTILGNVSARTIPRLENSIVTGPVVAAECQAGCLRYSFVPLAGSQTPRRFRCQPDLQIQTDVAAALTANPALPPAQRDVIVGSVEAALLPAFTSRRDGHPGYLQLADAAPDQIRLGAEEGDEMGVFFGLFSARRESNLAYRVNEFLPIGLEAGIIHAT